MKMKNLSMLLLPVLLGIASSAFADTILLKGVGGTFPEALYKKWATGYSKETPGVRIEYVGLSSSEGVKAISGGSADFGASDVPMTDAELQNAPEVVHIPAVLGAIALGYNLPATPVLRLSPKAISAIYLGTVTRWNDPMFAADNPGIVLPDLAIQVFHRSDASGTTAIFSDYLSKISPVWEQKVGRGKTVTWPLGVSISSGGSQAVAEAVKNNRGGIAAVELGFANKNSLGVATIQNKSGAFILPKPTASFRSAAATQIPADYRVSLTNASGLESYPITSFTYLLVKNPHPDAAKGRALAKFIAWATTEGQAAAAPLDYAPLPTSMAPGLKRTISALH